MSLLALLAAKASNQLTEVTAQAPTANDAANTIDIPNIVGVQYRIEGTPVSGTYAVGYVTAQITVTAHPLEGYVLLGDASWALSFTEGLVDLFPSASPTTVPAPIAHWDFRQTAAPYTTTASTGDDLPLAAKTTDPLSVASELGDALLFDGSQTLAIPAAELGRLHIGAGGTTVSVAAWVWLGQFGQIALAGIWGEFADPPQRQYALFFDLSAYGGNDMSCFHVSKDGAPTPGSPYSTDYSASPPQAQAGRWHHFLGTYDGAQAVSYIDGKAYKHTSGSTRTGDGKRNPYTFAEGLNDTPHEFAISTGGPLTGLLKDVRVWDEALTPGHALTLAAEHAPLPPVEQDTSGVTLVGDDAVDVGSPDGLYTHVSMPIGAPSPDRLVVAALYGSFNPARTLLSATIGGVAATVLPGEGIAFAYAVVPEGTTADVVTDWGRETWSHYCAIFTVEGTQKTHSSVGSTSHGSKATDLTSERGGTVLVFGHLSSATATWSPYITKLTEGTVANGSQFSLGTFRAPGWTYPVAMTNGIGTAPRAILALAFDSP